MGEPLDQDSIPVPSLWPSEADYPGFDPRPYFTLASAPAALWVQLPSVYRTRRKRVGSIDTPCQGPCQTLREAFVNYLEHEDPTHLPETFDSSFYDEPQYGLPPERLRRIRFARDHPAYLPPEVHLHSVTVEGKRLWRGVCPRCQTTHSAENLQ